MKVFVFICLLILCFTNLYSQAVLMEHIQTSFLLTGKDNFVSLIVEGIPCDELEAKIDDGGTITKMKDCEFMIRPSRIGDIEIYFLGKERTDPKKSLTDEIFQGTFPNNRFNEMNAVRKYINREDIRLYQAKYTQKNGGAVVRSDYDQFDNLLLVSEVDFKHRIDTTETFDPETYEQKLTMIDEYYDFPIGQYKLFYGDKNCPYEFRLQGRFDTNGRAGKWQACDYSKGYAEIYEIDYDLPDEKEVIKKIK